MSKIALSPNASGTGTFTIQSPNSDTDRTLTLPDAAGEVVINEGSGTFKIDSSGNVGIGTSSPGCTLDVVGGIRARGGLPGGVGVNNNGYAFNGTGDNDSGMFSDGDGVLRFYTNNGQRFSLNTRMYLNASASRGFSGYPVTTPDDSIANAIRQAGYIEWQTDVGAIGTSYFLSDISLKENIAPSTKASADIINAIKFVQFDWKPESGNKGHVEVGVVAQQLKEVDPRLTSELSDGKLMVNEPALLAHLGKALQEALTKIDQLETRVAQLEGASA